MVHQPNKDSTTTPPRGNQIKFKYCPLCGQRWDNDCDKYGCWECGYNYHTSKEFTPIKMGRTASELRIEYVRDIIKFLEKHNPYPLDVFPEPKDEDWNNLGNFLQMHGKNPDRIFAKFGRMVRQSIIDDIKLFL
ncbi:MAG: hypothetical protein ACLFQA_00250 [Bacteroidales bacterium]